MRCALQANLNKILSKKRTTAIVFLACFIVVSLFTEAFILARANHTHDNNGVGGACTTCAQLQYAENLLKQLGTAVVGVSFSLAELFAFLAIIRAVCPNMALLTPITLKIRMNN